VISRIAQAMADAVSTEIEHLNPDDVRVSFGQFVQAFLQSAEANDSSHFTSALAKLLEQFEAVGEDVYLLHPACPFFGITLPR
jgi:hypothetical protein